MTEQMICSDCGGAMEAGFIPDKADSNIDTQSYWTPGTPKKIRLWGFGRATAIKAPKQSEMLAVTTYRCTACGALKLFAHPRQQVGKR